MPIFAAEEVTGFRLRYAFIDNNHTERYILCMAQMNISIPDKLKTWVESRVADGSYASSSDYLRDLVRRDQRDLIQLEHLRAEIQAGRDSGISDVDPFDQIEQLRQRARAELAKRDAA
jgi:antitoxin ParD1/3/4